MTVASGGFCSSCGKPIMAEAEICPNCGVRQKAAPAPKGKSKGKIIGIVAAIIVVIGVIVVLGGGGSGKSEYVKAVKSGHINGYPNKTVGEAFGDFFSSAKWKGFDGTNGKKIAEFTGKCTFIGKKVDVLIQFALEDGGSFETSAFTINGKDANKMIYNQLIKAVYSK